jgi:hypothetical protein
MALHNLGKTCSGVHADLAIDLGLPQHRVCAIRELRRDNGGVVGFILIIWPMLPMFEVGEKTSSSLYVAFIYIYGVVLVKMP